MQRPLIAAILGMLCAIGVGCACDSAADSPGRSPPQESPAMQQLIGTLRSGFMGIGGEHTGWALLDGDGPGAKQTEVDVSRVRDAARVSDGKRVTLSGQWVEKRYVERGPSRIFSVDRIE